MGADDVHVVTAYASRIPYRSLAYALLVKHSEIVCVWGLRSLGYGWGGTMCMVGGIASALCD